MIKTIIFDADGVLIHREKYFSQLLLEEYKIPLEKSLVFFNGEFAECLIGKKDLKVILPKYLKEWGWSKSLEDLLTIWFESEKHIDQNLIHYIKELKKSGLKIYIGTNNEKYRTDYLYKNTDLGTLVHKIYGSGHLGFKKPDHKFFEYIVKEQKLKKKETLFWDDDQENVDAAIAYGIKAELYSNFTDFKMKMKNFQIK